ncbi:MAG: helix-turn-helix domain-containing protein, partial [Planctomycetota bacterium]
EMGIVPIRPMAIKRGGPMTKDEIRKEIKLVLKKKGWSVLDLSRQSKVSQRAISGFLDGGEEISPQVLYRLRKTLGMDKRS